MKFQFPNRECLFRIWPVCVAALAIIGPATAAPLIFSNGSVDPNRTTWNDTDPTFTIYDAFSLSSATTISQIDYSIFKQSSTVYDGTYVSILSGVGPGATIIVPQFFSVGSLVSNGLVSYNGAVPNGYDVSLSGLSLSLDAGTYYLGVRTEIAGGLASIGSGAGGAQTIGSGLYQAYSNTGTTNVGDHMAFSIYGDSADASVPDSGATIALLGSGLISLAALRRKLVKP